MPLLRTVRYSPTARPLQTSQDRNSGVNLNGPPDAAPGDSRNEHAAGVPGGAGRRVASNLAAFLIIGPRGVRHPGGRER